MFSQHYFPSPGVRVSGSYSAENQGEESNYNNIIIFSVSHCKAHPQCLGPMLKLFFTSFHIFFRVFCNVRTVCAL